jgi:uncharacterized protein (TIGR02246 family)
MTADAEIDQTFAEWEEAGRRGDAETLASLVTDDAEFWSQGRPTMRGRASVLEAFRATFAVYEAAHRWEKIERIVIGDWAFERGHEHNVVVNKSDGTRIEVRQRGFTVLHREADGRWRFARGMTNRES